MRAPRVVIATWPTLDPFDAAVLAGGARRGHLLIVRYGQEGSQLAQVLGHMPTIYGNVAVRKFRRTSGRWTGRTYVRPGEILAAGKAAEAYAREVLDGHELDNVLRAAAAAGRRDA